MMNKFEKGLGITCIALCAFLFVMFTCSGCKKSTTNASAPIANIPPPSTNSCTLNPMETSLVKNWLLKKMVMYSVSTSSDTTVSFSSYYNNAGTQYMKLMATPDTNKLANIVVSGFKGDSQGQMSEYVLYNPWRCNNDTLNFRVGISTSNTGYKFKIEYITSDSLILKYFNMTSGFNRYYFHK